MSALDDLVQSLQAAVTSVQTAQHGTGEAGTAADTAVLAAQEFGREGAVLHTDALRCDIEQLAATLGQLHQKLEEALQRATALQTGNAGRALPSGSPNSAAAASVPIPSAVAPARLPNAEHAEVDERKFTEYSMDPDNPRNNGKWKAWVRVGYDVHARRKEASNDVQRQLREQLPDAPTAKEEDTVHGQRRSTRTTVTGPNGRTGTLVCVWQYAPGSDKPRMITNWLRVHKEGDA